MKILFFVRKSEKKQLKPKNKMEEQFIKVSKTKLLEQLEQLSNHPDSNLWANGRASLIDSILQNSTLIEEEWVSEKPKIKDDCALLTATWVGSFYEFKNWEIKFLLGEYENGEPAWYWAVLDTDGDEFCNLEDLAANWYKIILPPRQ